MNFFSDYITKSKKRIEKIVDSFHPFYFVLYCSILNAFLIYNKYVNGNTSVNLFFFIFSLNNDNGITIYYIH